MRPTWTHPVRTALLAATLGSALAFAAACATTSAAPPSQTGGTSGSGGHTAHARHKSGVAASHAVAYTGTITALATSRLGLDTTAHRTISLLLLPTTKVVRQATGAAPSAVPIGSLAVGERVRVKTRTGSAGLSALQVSILPQSPGTAALRGTIIAVGASALTLRTASGGTVSVTLPADTQVQTIAAAGAAPTASTPSALQAGESVSIRPAAPTSTSTSTAVASRITIHG